MSTCILIHGTWGSRSDFGFTDSLFCRAIKAAVQHDIEFERFEWSGSNSSMERMKAAKQLRDFVRELASGRAPVYLITHSHGGNVALEALQSDETAQRVGGLITLGTPFLSSEARRWVSFISTFPGRMSLYAVFTGLIAVCIFAVAGSYGGFFHFAFGILGVLIILVIVVLSAKSENDDLFETLASSAKAAESALTNPGQTPVAVNLFVITSRADEALWWLQRVVSFTNLPFALSDIGLWVLGWGTLIAIVIGNLGRVIRLLDEKYFDENALVLLAPMVVSVALGLALATTGILVIAITKLIHHLVGTGRAVSLWAEIATRTKVTRLPNQTCNNLEEIQVPIANIHGGLWHTKYTRSGAVVDHIARKIGEWHQQLSTRDAAQQTVAADAVTRRG